MRIFPPFIKFLFISNGIIFFIQMFFDNGFRFAGIPLDAMITQWFALWPLKSGLLMPWQLITYQFMHGGFGHICFNMFALWMFGMELENMWGTRKFATFYLASDVAAGLVHLAISFFTDSAMVPTIGASGAIMGVLLAFGMTFPTRPVMIFPLFFPIPARIFVVLYAAFDLVMGISRSGDGVAHFAHLGGALGGFLLIKYGEPLWRWIEQRGSQRQTWTEQPYKDARFRDVPTQPPAQVIRYEAAPTPPSAFTPSRFIVNGQAVSQEQIDAILDKISLSGYHNLSEEEKKILFEVSKQL
ncbi:rhomboid family intramembrane serine protease [soil metagenome]